MQAVLQQLEDIELKIKDLAQKYSAARQENEKLIDQNKSLINDLEELRQTNENLESQLLDKDSEAKSRFSMENSERIKMQRELGQYIKQIDKCITMVRAV